MSKPIQTSALLVADTPGHILEWRGQTWMRHGRGADFELVCSSETPPFVCCWRGLRRGLIHWIDTRRFLVCASAVTVPQVAMVHYLGDEQMATAIARLTLADAIVTTSRRWQTKLEHLTDRPVWIIPDTVDSQIFCPSADRAGLRAAAGIQPHEFVLGFIGKALADTSGRKGTDVLLQVLAAARAQWSDICLLLVGPGWETLAATIEKFGVRVIRREYPNTQSTAAAYALMDALLVTARVEGGPCTLIEAMATGVPVITSDVGHVPEVVADGVNGFVCPQRTPAEYVEKIARLRQDPQLRQGIIRAAHEFIAREREEKLIVPRHNFEEIYSHARQHYRRRAALDRVTRRFPLAYWAARFAAGKLAGK
jgi:glycosyltransferase involved in cell wall biosynthesis